MEELKQMTFIDNYENVDVVLGEPQDSEGRVYIPMFDVRRVSGAALRIMDAGKHSKHKGSAETETIMEGEESVHLQTRPLAHIEVSAEGVQIRPVLDRKRILVGAVLLSSWIVGWVSAALLSAFRRKV